MVSVAIVCKMRYACALACVFVEGVVCVCMEDEVCVCVFAPRGCGERGRGGGVGDGDRQAWGQGRDNIALKSKADAKGRMSNRCSVVITSHKAWRHGHKRGDHKSQGVAVQAQAWSSQATRRGGSGACTRKTYMLKGAGVVL